MPGSFLSIMAQRAASLMSPERAKGLPLNKTSCQFPAAGPKDFTYGSQKEGRLLLLLCEG